MKWSFLEIRQIFKEVYRKGFFHLFSSNVLILFFAFASQLLVAWVLSPEDVGRIKIIQTYLSLFSVVASMGFFSSTLKLCSEEGEEGERRRFFRSGLLFLCLSACCCYFVLLVLNSLGVLSNDVAIRVLIPLGLLPLITNSVFMIFVAYAQATKRIQLLSKLTVLNKLVSIIGIILLTFFLGIKGYFIAYNLSFILMLALCVRLFKQVLFEQKRMSMTKIDLKSYLKRHWKYAKSAFFAEFFSNLSVFLDIFLINFFVHDMHEIGLYSFALTLTIIFRLFPSTVQQISMPYFSTLTSDRVSFSAVYKRYNRLLFLVVLFTLIIALLLVPNLLHLVFSGKYDGSIVYFYPLAIAWSIRQMTQLQSAAIFGFGKLQYIAYNSIIFTFINAIFICIALKYWGIIGVAYSCVLSQALYLLVMTIFFKKVLRETK